MLKFQIVTKNDLKEAAMLERRKRYENERKERIFNAKQRLFGQDYKALELQVAEKKKQHIILAEEDKLMILENNRRALVIHQKEKEIAEQKQQYQAEIDLYRCRYQKKEDRREFDLNDPEFHKKSEPARRSDFDPRLGISSAQIFMGEDLMGVSRKAAQQEQQRSWLDQQIREKKQDDMDRAKADLMLHNALKARDQETLLYASYERDNKAKLQNSILDFNKKLAKERKEKDKIVKQHEEEDNLAEIYNMMSSDMLTENPETANSRLGINKKIAFLYRGMSPAELEVFRREQKQQIQLNEKKRTEEKVIDKIWDQQDINLTRAVMLKNLEVNRKTKVLRTEFLIENKQLAEEQKARNIEIDKTYGHNCATDEFFEQFNRTSR